jgi:hypothetical protein
MVAIALAASLFAKPAFAYIGPGAGITVLGALWGVVVAVVLALAAVILWPLRVLFRRRRRKPVPATDLEATASAADTPGDAPRPSAH